MTITTRVQQLLFSAELPHQDTRGLVRLPPTVVTQYSVRDAQLGDSHRPRSTRRRTNLWSVDEHERFLLGLECFPNGPWKEIAGIVGTKTTRQTMTHAQKYRQKIERQRFRSSYEKPRAARTINGTSRTTQQPVATAEKGLLAIESDALDVDPEQLLREVETLILEIERSAPTPGITMCV